MVNRKVVIDTNVVISAIIGQYNYPYKIFADLISTGDFQIYISKALLAEYKGVSQREKFRKYPGFAEKATEMISSIEKIGKMVNPRTKINVIDDEFDNRLLEIALEADAFCIVTGNTKDFNFTEYEGIAILSPKEFYELATSSRP